MTSYIYIHLHLFVNYMLINLIHIDLLTRKKLMLLTPARDVTHYIKVYYKIPINKIYDCFNKLTRDIYYNFHNIIYFNNITISFVISCKVELHGSVWRNHLSLNSIYADILNLTFLCPPYSLINCCIILKFN